MRVFTNKLRNYRSHGVALAVPALLMALLIAAALSVNSAQAQAPGEDDPPPGDVNTGVDHNKIEYSEPYPCNGDEPVPHGAAESVDFGHYAVFDAFWDYNHKRLSNNFCPPGAEHTTIPGRFGRPDVVTTTREQSNIDIRKTVFSITDDHRVSIVATTSPTAGEISRGTYPFLSASSTEAWWMVPDDDTTLAVGFSAGLLKDEHWQAPRSGGKAVQYEFEALELPSCLDANEEAHFYVFETGSRDAKWDSSNTDTNDLQLDPGEYAHLNWVFTCPGIYKIQVHFKGHVKEGAQQSLGISPEDKTITSEAHLYTFHVGPEDDLGVSITPDEQTLAANATSTSFTVTAKNGGPDDAARAMVQVQLPEGLNADTSTLPANATYESEGGVIAWNLGSLAPTSTSTEPTLSFTANVVDATAKQLVIAEIRNLAHGELDSNSENDIAVAYVNPSNDEVRPPSFSREVTCEIVEHAISGSHCGEPIEAVSPDGRALTYTLSGRGSGLFSVHGNGQIVKKAGGASLNYERQWNYRLTLGVSDGVNPMGNSDTSTDDSIPVRIEVIDTPEGAVHPTVTFSLSNPAPGTQHGLNTEHPVIGYTVLINPAMHNLPAGVIPSFGWEYSQGRLYYGNLPVVEFAAGDHTYRVHIKWNGGGITAEHTIHWYEPSDEYPGPNS